jgi:hypothetical protein
VFGLTRNYGKDYQAMARNPAQQQQQFLHNNSNNSNNGNAGNQQQLPPDKSGVTLPLQSCQRDDGNNAW